MKRILLLLAISANVLYGMEESSFVKTTADVKPGQEKNEIKSSQAVRLWDLLGNSGTPELKFIAALDLIKRNETEITRAHIPEELKEYIVTLKHALEIKIFELMQQAVLLDSDRENIELLINAGANLDMQDNNGHTALIYAVVYNNEDGVKLLISIGANLDLSTAAGRTALMVAASEGSVPIVKHLINAGANIDRQTITYGNTALTLATEKGHIDVAKLLIDAEANLSIQNSNGYTALIKAAIGNGKDLIKLLLQAGADVTLKDKKGKTAIDHAFYLETKRLLQGSISLSS